MTQKTPLKKFLVVMALALGLPSTIVGLFFLGYQLVQNEVISYNALLITLVGVVALTLGLMVKYVLVKKDKQ